MVDDHAQTGMPRGEDRHELEVPRQHGHDIEGHAALLEHTEGFVDIGTQQPVRIRLVVDEVAHSDHQRVPRPFVEGRRRRGRIIERGVADDPDDLRVGRGGRAHQGGVLGVVRRLHLDGEVDACRTQLGREVVERHRDIDRREVRSEPVVLGRRRIPDVLMRVDNGEGHFVSVCSGRQDRGAPGRLLRRPTRRAGHLPARR